MKIWVDADACPVVIKEILYRAAMRRGLLVILVANQAMRIPEHPKIQLRVVDAGFDIADQTIIENLAARDLVITADIPLAADAIAKQALVLDPRGEAYTLDNIGMRLHLRDFMDKMRSTGTETGGPPPFKASDRQAFANQLDRLLTQYFKSIEN